MDEPESQSSAKNIALYTTLKLLDLDWGETRYATLHHVGDNVYICARTV